MVCCCMQVRDPVMTTYHMAAGDDPTNPGNVRTRFPYHIRVCVPCYKESLEILRRTIMAAYDATLPTGCARTIYLCDDGKARHLPLSLPSLCRHEHCMLTDVLQLMALSKKT